MQETLNQQSVKTKRANMKAIQARRRRIVLFLSAAILCVVSFSIVRAYAKQPQEQNNIVPLTIESSEQENQIISDEPSNSTIDGNQSQNNEDSQTEKENHTTTGEQLDSQVTQWNLLLVNPWNKTPSNYKISLTQLKNGQSVDERVYEELQKMMDDCRAAGLSPLICSSYRTNEKQERLFNNKIENYKAKGYSEEDAKKEAAKWVAVPGTSEHQLGLSVDIVSLNNQMLDESQEKTEEQKWLMKNSYKYGFILRYPSDKIEITGISYEPWHYRYVGKEAAAEITQKGIALEEYLGNL